MRREVEADDFAGECRGRVDKGLAAARRDELGGEQGSSHDCVAVSGHVQQLHATRGKMLCLHCEGAGLAETAKQKTAWNFYGAGY